MIKNYSLKEKRENYLNKTNNNQKEAFNQKMNKKGDNLILDLILFVKNNVINLLLSSVLKIVRFKYNYVFLNEGVYKNE